MKTLKKLSYISFGLLFLLSSCSIEKRQYLSGYNIEWGNFKTNTNKKELANNNIKVNSEQEAIASNELPSKAITSINTDEKLTVSTDNMIAVQIPVKIFATKKQTENIVSEKVINATKEQSISKKSENKMKPAPNDDSDMLISFLLCLFFGVLGVHRFYLGYMGTGILYLLTGGLCGIGVLVDLILILTGNLKRNK